MHWAGRGWRQRLDRRGEGTARGYGVAVPQLIQIVADLHRPTD